MATKKKLTPDTPPDELYQRVVYLEHELRVVNRVLDRIAGAAQVVARSMITINGVRVIRVPSTSDCAVKFFNALVRYDEVRRERPARLAKHKSANNSAIRSCGDSE